MKKFPHSAEARDGDDQAKKGRAFKKQPGRHGQRDKQNTKL